MIVRLELDDKTAESLSAMRMESGLGVEFLCEVAVWNLIAVWMRDRGIGIEADTADDAGIVSAGASG